jgi:uncharacterized protein
MQKDIFWTPLPHAGCEHVSLKSDKTGIYIDSLVISVRDEKPVRLSYFIVCDTNWRTKQLNVKILGSESSIELTADGEGNWFDKSTPMPELKGCIDVDITVTPFTNSLPIRRLDFQVGESKDLLMVFVTVPEMTVRVDKQKYTLLEKLPDGAKYLFESGDFQAELNVDADGFVLTYPKSWQQTYKW